MAIKHKNVIFCLVVAGVVLSGSLLPQGILNKEAYAAVTQADLNNIRDQINKVKDKIEGYESEARRLVAQADTLANQIELLKAEENLLISQIEMSQTEYDQLVAKIDVTEKRISDNSETVGYIIAQYYYNEKVSTIERLASSENLAGFIDDEARLSGMSDSLSGIVNENKALKVELEKQRQEVEFILADLGSQQKGLIAKKTERQNLLDETRGMERKYQSLKTAANSRREQLEAQQQKILQDLNNQNNAIGITPGDPNKGGYPHSKICPKAKWNGTQYGDRWGMYVCECVSYTAWKVYQNYKNMPNWGGKGNANQWLANAKESKVPTGMMPKVGSVGVINAGTWGHVVWVERVKGAQIYISQYNERNAATNWKSGEYSEKWINASAFDGFIYFDNWHY